jgi:hypothetical protein
MLGTKYTLDDVRKVIEMLAIYCQPGPNGERPKCLYRDLLIFGLTALRVTRTGKDPDARYQISDDWRRRIELMGLNPLTLQIEDEAEFKASVARLEWRRQQREAAQAKRREARGFTKPFYKKGERAGPAYWPEPPPESANGTDPPGQPVSGTNWAEAAKAIESAKAEAKERLANQHNGW